MELKPFIVYIPSETLSDAMAEAQRVFSIDKGKALSVRLPNGQHGYQYALSLIESRDPRFFGLWSPAGAIHEPPGFFLFGFHR